MCKFILIFFYLNLFSQIFLYFKYMLYYCIRFKKENMKTYSDIVIKAHKKYCDLLAKNQEGIENLYGKEYDNRQRNISRACDNFDRACKAEGLNYITVNMDLIPSIIKVN